jgi:hypothetical protein
MNARAIAEKLRAAARHGVSPKEVLPFRPPSLGGSARCVTAIRGAVADGSTGVVCQLVALRGPGLPAAQYEVSGLGDVIEGLWVRTSGRNVWTRVALPRGYSELMLPSEAFTGRHRVAIASDRDEDCARRLLSSDFLAWLADVALDGGRLDVGTSFEIWHGVLFVRGPIDAFKSPEKLDAFAAAAARIATEVAAVARSPAPVSLAVSHAWACDICGGVAGSIALGEHGQVRRESFTSQLTRRLADAAAGRLRAALAAGDATAVYELDPELAVVVPGVPRAYCGDHWRRPTRLTRRNRAGATASAAAAPKAANGCSRTDRQASPAAWARYRAPRH